jgi:phage/plasmid-like protein (TIGR03299 family)
MTHEIDITTGKAAFAYVGEEAWHGLGQQLTEGSDLDTWRVEAGMDWTVNEADVQYKVNEEYLTFGDRRLLYRSDNNSALSVVSGNYNIVQPREVLEFFRDLTESRGFTMETAGVLFGGRKFWALAKAGKSVTLLNEDEVKPYLLIATSVDGSMSTVAHFTSVRVVCNNTLRMSIGNNDRAMIKIPHNAMLNPDVVKAQLGLAEENWDKFVTNVIELSNFKIDYDYAVQIVADELKAANKIKILNSEGNPYTQQELIESSSVLRRIISLYDGDGLGSKYKSSEGTAWGLINAVTQFADHEAGSKKEDRSRAFERAHLTDWAKFKVSVADRLLESA